MNQRSASEGRGAVLDVFKEVFLQRGPWIEGVHCEVGQVRKRRTLIYVFIGKLPTEGHYKNDPCLKVELFIGFCVYEVKQRYNSTERNDVIITLRET